jgi:hypothetical protein
MCLEHTFHQVMSRSATLCALLILCSHGIYGCQVDLKLSFSQSSSWNMRLNLNVVPVFQTMSDPGLGIPALPRKPADVNNFVRDLVRWGQDTFLSYQDNKKYSLRSLVVLGTESTQGHLFFPATMKDSDGKNFPAQNPAAFTKEDLLKLNPQFPDAEIALLIEDFQTPMFKNGPLHFYLQSQLRRAVDLAVSSDTVFSHQYRQLARMVQDSGDMYQGSRAVANLITCLQEYIIKHQLALDAESNIVLAGLGSATPTSFQQAVELLEQHSLTLTFAGLPNLEATRVNQIVLAVKHHTNHLIAAVVNVVPVPTTFEALRVRLLNMPYEPDSSSESYNAHAFFARAPESNVLRGHERQAKRDGAVHTDAYVNTLKRRLQHTEEVALKHGAKKDEFRLPSKSTPVASDPKSRWPFGRGGGIQGSNRQHRKDSDAAITAAAAVAPATSPAPEALLKPNGVVEIYTASVSTSVSGTPITGPEVEWAPASMEVKAVSSAEIPLDLWPSPGDEGSE